MTTHTSSHNLGSNFNRQRKQLSIFFVLALIISIFLYGIVKSSEKNNIKELPAPYIPKPSIILKTYKFPEKAEYKISVIPINTPTNNLVKTLAKTSTGQIIDERIKVFIPLNSIERHKGNLNSHVFVPSLGEYLLELSPSEFLNRFQRLELKDNSDIYVVYPSIVPEPNFIFEKILSV